MDCIHIEICLRQESKLDAEAVQNLVMKKLETCAYLYPGQLEMHSDDALSKHVDYVTVHLPICAQLDNHGGLQFWKWKVQ